MSWQQPPPVSPPPLLHYSPGWYADPWVPGGWRWWDGRMWTQFASAPSQSGTSKPRLPRWLSVPVLIAAPLVVLGIIIVAVFDPLAVLGSLVPIIFVWPVARIIDRVEPEPLGSRIHAVLWGATVAIMVSVVIELILGFVLGSTGAPDWILVAIGAPVIEEAAKGLGVVWAVRRNEVDGVSDGVVYAGLVALGFAVVEDVGYIAGAPGPAWQIFVLRAVLTPFAHPLFTMWIGLAIGRQVRRGQPLLPGALGGYALAVLAHMAWNGSLSVADAAGDYGGWIIILMAALFFVLFVSVAIALRRSGKRERDRFVALAPTIAMRLGFPPADQIDLSSWRLVMRKRRSLPRSKRRAFDDFHAAIARLTMLYERPTAVDPIEERVLVEQVRQARAKLGY